MVRRVESPSSINTYKQCPRKYYYAYIEKIPTTSNIHAVRGNVVHTVMEDFFDIDVNAMTPLTFESEVKQKMQTMLLTTWLKSREKIKGFGLTKEQEMFYFEESLMMLFNWVSKFTQKLNKFSTGNLAETFKALTPIREKQYRSPERSVRGFIDAIENHNGSVRIMDYKTSKRFGISKPYKLQLAIYALMYKDEHGELPSEVGIYFLKDTGKHEHVLSVDEDLVTWAKEEVEVMHYNSKSDKKEDYPLVKSGLCKWSTGQCDFYEYCFKGKSVQ